MNINFYLKKNKNSKNNEHPIFCYIRHNYKLKSFFTGQRINPQFWDAKKQQAKKGYAEEFLLNEYLHSYKKFINKIILTVKTEDPSADFAKIVEAIERRLKNTEERNLINLLQIYTEHIKSLKSRGYAVNFEVAISKLIECFGQHVSVKILEPANIFVDKFINYMSAQNMQTNSGRRYLLAIKTALKWLHERGYLDNIDNSFFNKIKPPKEAPKNFVTLDFDEINRIKQAVLPDRLEAARDLFLFQLYTGQRFSDIQAFDKDQLDNTRQIWQLRQKKDAAHRKTIRIPLITPAIDILKKYNYNLPKLQIRTFNYHIKEVCEIAKIDDISIKEVIKLNNEVIKIKKKKYELVSSHTARRTFATLAIYHNVNVDVIKNFTGHATDSMLSRYFQKDVEKSKNLIEQIFMN